MIWADEADREELAAACSTNLYALLAIALAMFLVAGSFAERAYQAVRATRFLELLFVFGAMFLLAWAWGN